MEYLLILSLMALSALILRIAIGVQVFASWRHAIATIGVCLVVGTAWDSYAIARGHWSFDEAFLLGVEIGYMPVEEYLFIVIVPLWVLVVYRAIETSRFVDSSRGDT